MTCTLIPDEQHPSLAKLIGLALPDGECVILEISTVDLRNPQQTIAHQSNACRIPQPCKQIRFTRIAAVSDRGETTLFDYADYQVVDSLEIGNRKTARGRKEGDTNSPPAREIYPKNPKRLRNTLEKSK